MTYCNELALEVPSCYCTGYIEGTYEKKYMVCYAKPAMDIIMN